MPEKPLRPILEAPVVPCPHCGSTDTEMTGLFGPFHLASQYHCRACHSPFGRMRWQSEKPSGPDKADKP